MYFFIFYFNFSKRNSFFFEKFIAAKHCFAPPGQSLGGQSPFLPCTPARTKSSWQQQGKMKQQSNKKRKKNVKGKAHCKKKVF